MLNFRSSIRKSAVAPAYCRIPAMLDCALVENITEQGCRIRLSDARLGKGSRLILELVQGVHVCGEVVWSRRSTAGVLFEHPIHPAIIELVLSSRPADPKVIGKRPRRVA